MPDFILQEALSKGLREDSNNSRNSQELTALNDLIPTEWGLKQIPVVTYPLSSPSLSMSWPHPQILNGEFNKLLANKTTIHEINLSALTGASLSFVGSVAPTTSSQPWEMASFAENIWFLTNITNFVYRLPANASGNAAVVTAFTVNSLANHNGMLVLGGVGGTLPATLEAFFDEWKELDFTGDRTVSEDTTLAKNWIVYSDMGGGARDVPFYSFMQMFEEPAATAPTTEMMVVIRDQLERGEIGFFPLKREGDIKRLLPLGNDLVAYTRSGVSILRMTEAGYREEEILDIGVLYSGNVGGDKSQHIFITEQADLYRLRGNELEKLNYREYMDTLTLSATVICYDPDERYFTISDSNNGFTLTRTGLAATDAILPSSMCRMQGYEGLAGTPVNEGGTVAASLTTDIFDAGSRGVHEIVYVNIATTDTTTAGWTVQVMWRMNKNDNFTTESAVTFDDRGVARVKVSGIEFKLILTAEDRTKVDLERIEVVLRQGGKKKLRQLIA